MPVITAVRVHQTGCPDVLRMERVELPAPGPDDVRLRHTAIGVNFIDTYHRSGLYPQSLPFIPGVEGAGIVEQVGSAVRRFRPGARVAYAHLQGSYAEARLAPADRLISIPDEIPDDVAAAVLLRGMTVEFLVRRCCPVTRGDRVLWHAAAGGVGTIAVQWLKSIGAMVIGTAGSPDKCALASRMGADVVIDYTHGDWVQQVREVTSGKGVDVVFDGVGKTTFTGSLDCLKPRGHLVTFGNASGAVPPIEPLELMRKGSLTLTRPTLGHYIATRPELEESAGVVFRMIAQRIITAVIGARFPLSDAATAHRELEARRVEGSLLLVP